MLTNSNKIKNESSSTTMLLPSLRLKCNGAAITRVAITYVVILMVLSTPSLMLVYPTAAALAPPLLEETISNRVDTSSYHSSLPISEMYIPTSTSTSMLYNPSSISSATIPTTQAALQNVLSFQSNDIVNSKAIYEILFRTATTGPIKTIEMVFPAGTDISGAGYIERIGIGAPDSWIKSGNKITYTVASPVSVPAGTPIRFELVNVKNPSIPSSNYQVTVTTRDAANTIIDGPSNSQPYNVRQIGTNDIANNQIVASKISSPFIVSRVWNYK